MKKFLESIFRSKSPPVVLFGVVFGLLEAIVVIYLNQLFNTGGTLINHRVNPDDIALSLGFISFLKPQASVVITQSQRLLSLELWREASTIVILLTVAWIAGKTLKDKFAYFLLAFAVWDIFYYVFLKVFTNWPTSLLDLDILFLIPVAWVGFVITPVAISLLMIAVAALLLAGKQKQI